MTPEVPQIDVSDPQGAMDSLQFQEPGQAAPPPFKSRFADIIKQYEGMLAKAQEEDGKASSALNDLMNPDAFKDRYLPKPTARGILQDALYNFGMSYQASKTGQKFTPIEEKRMDHAMQQYQLDTQNKRVDMERSRATMQNLLGQMQQYRLAQNAEESQFQAEQKQKLAEQAEIRRQKAVDAEQKFKQAVFENVTLPSTASKIQRDAANIQLENAMAERMKLAKNPIELAQQMLTDPFYQTPGVKEKATEIYEKLMKASRAGQVNGSNAWAFRPLGIGLEPGIGQVAMTMDRAGNINKTPTGTVPVSQFDDQKQLSNDMDNARGAASTIAEAIGKGYLPKMTGLSKSGGIGDYTLDKARRMGLYGEYDKMIEGGLDQYNERIRTGTIGRGSGKAFTAQEINEVQKWMPDKMLDTPKGYALNTLKVSLWEQLSIKKQQQFTGREDTVKNIGFANIVNQQAEKLYKELENYGDKISPVYRQALIDARVEEMYQMAFKGSGARTVSPPPNTPMAPAPPKSNEVKPQEVENNRLKNIAPSPANQTPGVKKWNRELRRFE